MESSLPTQLVGWVVWGKVRSLPWWPGQVMHPSKGPLEVRKMAAMKTNAGKLLVMFLGDNKYAFLTPDSVVDFADYRERHSSTNYASKFWKLGLEEAEEVLARRSGLQPATKHEPVDFAAKNSNFSLLAKAWARGAPCSKKASGSGRPSERSKTSTPNPEVTKQTSLTQYVTETTLATSERELGKSPRAQMQDDGRLKFMGGVVLEWAPYMPLVAATRKGAEASPSDATLQLVRRLGRGEWLPEGPLDTHGLQLLHSLCLQRRVLAVEDVAKRSLGGLAAAAGQGHSGTAAHGGEAGTCAVLTGAGLGSHSGSWSVLVQQVSTVANATEIPVPTAVWDALQAVQCEAASLWSDCADGQQSAEAASSSAAAALAMSTEDTDPGGGMSAPPPAGSVQVPQQVIAQWAYRQRIIEVDVVLKVNGKFVPHVSPGRIAWSDASCGGSCGALGVASQGMQFVAETTSTMPVSYHPRARALPASPTAVVSCSLEERGLGQPPFPSQQEPKLAPGNLVIQDPTAGPAEAAPAAGAAPSQRTVLPDTKATSGSVISHPCPQATPPRASPLGIVPASSSGTMAAYTPPSHRPTGTPLPGHATTTNTMSPESPRAALLSSAQPPVATLDLSLGLAPWMRGEIRITSWTVAGPRALLMTVAANRKRDGGLGGIKREARLLLAEAEERRAISPEVPGVANEEAGISGEEPKLKRRLRSAIAASSPTVAPSTAINAVGSAVMGPAQGQDGGRASQPLQPSAAQPSPQQHQQLSSRSQAVSSRNASQSAEGLPSIPTSGPAAAALMRSRLLQQKRAASAAEALTDSTGAAVPMRAAGNWALDGLEPQAGGEAAKTAAIFVSGAGGASDDRAAKKLKVVRFPLAAASGAATAGSAAADNGTTGNAVTRTSSGGVMPVAGTAAGVGPAVAIDATRRRVSYSQQLIAAGNCDVADGLEEPGQQGAVCGDSGILCVGGNTGAGGGGSGNAVGLSCRDQDWHTWYPPWLPQPALKGPFITVSHHLRNNHHCQNQNQKQSQHCPYSSELVCVASTARHAPQTSHFLQASFHHSYNHHHQVQRQASAPYQQPPGALGSPHFSNTSLTVLRRPSGHTSCNLPGEPFAGGVEYSSGSSRESEYPADARMIAPGWLPQHTATMTQYGTVSSVAACNSIRIQGPLAAGSSATSCGQILLDICVGNEGDLDAAPLGEHPNSVEAAIAVTGHLPPPEALAAGGTATVTTPPKSVHHYAPHEYGSSYPSSAAVNMRFSLVATAHSNPKPSCTQVADAEHVPRIVLPVSPFAEQTLDPISPCAAASTMPLAPAPTTSAGGAFFSPDAEAARVCSIGGMMTAADLALAKSEDVLADRHICVCELLPDKGSYGLGAGAQEAGVVASTARLVGGAGPGATQNDTAPAARTVLPMPPKRLAMVIAPADASGKVLASPPSTVPSCVTSCEEEVMRLRRMCEELQEQVKLRLAHDSLDPPPQQRLSYAELLSQVSERILALALQLPALSGPAKNTFIQFSRTLMQEAAVYGGASMDANAIQQQLGQPAMAAVAAMPMAPAACIACPVSSASLDAGRGGSHVRSSSQCCSGDVASGRSLVVARVAADLVRSAAAPYLSLHPDDRWAFINLAAELLQPEMREYAQEAPHGCR